MTCAEFERGVIDVLDLVDGAERAATLRRLRDHAAACPECAGADDLVLLLDAEPDQRDLVDEPPPRYWDGFEESVRERLSATRPSPASTLWGRAIAVAAVVVLAMLAAWWGSTRLGDGGDGAAIIARNAPPESARRPEQPAPPTDDVRGDAHAHDAVAVADDPDESPGFGSGLGLGAERDGWLLPGVDTLDEAERRALLEWLQNENARARGVSG